MTEVGDARLDALEKEVQRLKAASGTGTTIALPIAGVIAGLVYLAVVQALPLPGNPTPVVRGGIGLASAMGGGIVVAGAIGFVRFSLRALVEIAVVALVFANLLVGVLTWMVSGYFVQLLSELNVFDGVRTSSDQLLAAVFVTSAAGLFVVDVLLLLSLYPLSKVSGSSSLDDF